MKFSWLMGITALLAIAPASAATFTVSTVGDDAADGVNRPFRTVARGLAAARDGDTVVLRAGTYVGGISINQPRITLRSYPKETGTIATGIDTTAPESVVKLSEGAIGVRLQGIEIVGGEYYGLKINGDKRNKQTVVEDCIIRGAGHDCVKITPGADGITFRRTEFAFSGQREPRNAEGIDNVCGDDMVVQDCYFHDIATNGVYPKGGARNAIIERSRFDRCGNGGVMLGYFTDPEWFDTGENPRYFESINALVRNCVITNTGGPGIGLYAAHNAQVYNNTLINVALQYHAGVALNLGETPTPCEGLRFSNNIVVMGGQVDRPVFAIRPNAYAGQLHASNNLFYRGGQPVHFEDAGWIGSLGDWQSRKGCETASIVADPRLKTDFTLAANSPARGIALALNAVTDDFLGRVRSGALDLGAFQTGATGGDTGGGDTGGGGGDPGGVTPLWMFNDTLLSGWQTSSNGASFNLDVLGSAFEGAASIGLAVVKREGYLQIGGAELNTAGRTHLKFALHGGTKGGQQLRVRALVKGALKTSLNLWNYRGRPLKGGWIEVSVPLADLQASGAPVTGLRFSAGTPQSKVFLDAIRVE